MEQRLKNLSFQVDSVDIENVSHAKLLSVLMTDVSFCLNMLIYFFIRLASKIMVLGIFSLHVLMSYELLLKIFNTIVFQLF